MALVIERAAARPNLLIVDVAILFKRLIVARSEVVIAVACIVEIALVGNGNPGDFRAGNRAAKVERRVNIDLDRVACDDFALLGFGIDQEFGRTELGDLEAHVEILIMVMGYQRVTAQSRTLLRFIFAIERSKVIECQRLGKNLLALRISDTDLDWRVGGHAELYVILIAHDSPEVDWMAGAIDRLIGVQVHNILARLRVLGDLEIVGSEFLRRL